jgi:hypothetical protein
MTCVQILSGGQVVGHLCRSDVTTMPVHRSFGILSLERSGRPPAAAERVMTFTVLGVPQPQGSMRALLSRSTGRPMVKADNPKLGSWRNAAGWAAHDALNGL